MAQYLSTFAQGLEEPAVAFLQTDLPGCSVERVLSGGVHYRRRALPEEFPPWMNNSYLVLMFFNDLDESALQGMVRLAIKRGLDGDTLARHLPADATTCRVLFMQDGAVSHMGARTQEKAEYLMSTFSGLEIDRAQPDVEFWFVARPEGCGFLLLRLTGHQRGRTAEGELRADLSSLMCRMMNPKPGQTLLAPYCALGGMASAAIDYPYNTVIACEEDPGKLQVLNRRFATIHRVTPLLTAHPALPDAPAGRLDAMAAHLDAARIRGDIGAFYRLFLSSARRLLKKDGMLCVLCYHKNELFAANGQGLYLIDHYETSVAGKRACLAVYQK